MKSLIYLLVLPALIFTACGSKAPDKTAELAKLKKERADLDQKIKTLEGSDSDTTKKATPVSVLEVNPGNFVATIDVQSEITSEQNVYASPQMGGIVKDIKVHAGQHVTKGEVLATLDAAAMDEQIDGQQAQLTLAKALYEKQTKLWAENIGTEVQLLQAKANYESAGKQHDALIAQRNMYRIVSPLTGIIDQMTLKEGDAIAPGSQSIRVVNTEQLKAEANLGESYLGKVRQGNAVTLVLPDINDSIKTKLTYVAEAVDPISRAFVVQVHLGSNGKLHPNMSCIMKIANYENAHVIAVPVSVIQKTSQGEMVYIADGNKAKSVYVKTGQTSNGQTEVLDGLKPGDKVIVAGYEDLDNGESIVIE